KWVRGARGGRSVPNEPVMPMPTWPERGSTMLLAAWAVAAWTASATDTTRIGSAARSHRWLRYGMEPPSPSRCDPRRSGTGVELTVHLAQVAAVEVGVDRGGADAGVAEQL